MHIKFYRLASRLFVTCTSDLCLQSAVSGHEVDRGRWNLALISIYHTVLGIPFLLFDIFLHDSKCSCMYTYHLFS